MPAAACFACRWFGAAAATAVAVSMLGAPAAATFTPAQPPAEPSAPPPAQPAEAGTPQAAPKADMDWWRQARFGMFIHWGLYAVPAGQWKGATDHAEWIRTTAQIPVEEYEKFRDRFNPVKFDARAWVRLAKDAGVKYIVITSKHHDGFCLFDSKQTDFDVMSTPFHRDIMKEMADACHAEGVQICWYHSIMDWHHPDYLPRRDWEHRPTEGADFNRYVAYLKAQVRELLTNYGKIGVMWFDGQWEGTWTHERGLDLDAYVRSLQPGIIVNNRVDKGGGEYGMTKAGYAGDYGTPEQEIPPTGMGGVDWETCMTMNDHWGYNSADQNFKSTEDLIRKLADISSKGGNFLLNVGPTAEGEIPGPSVERLKAIGVWMKVNSESIYGTSAGPFRTLAWGRCTAKTIDGGKTRLYLHVFDWPRDGSLVVPGIFNDAAGAYLLVDPARKPLSVSRREDALVVTVPSAAPDRIDSVVVLDVAGKPDISEPPVIAGATTMFVGTIDVPITSDRRNITIRYTTDGTDPRADSPVAAGGAPVRLTATSTLSARAFRDSQPVSGVARMAFTKVTPRPAEKGEHRTPGVRAELYEGDFNAVPDFDKIKPASVAAAQDFTLAKGADDHYFAYRFRAYLNVPKDGVYVLATNSDDGSRLSIGDTLVVDNDGLHSLREKSGQIALGAGLHPITVTYFEKTGGHDLEVFWSGPGVARQKIPASALFQP